MAVAPADAPPPPPQVIHVHFDVGERWYEYKTNSVVAVILEIAMSCIPLINLVFLGYNAKKTYAVLKEYNENKPYINACATDHPLHDIYQQSYGAGVARVAATCLVIMGAIHLLIALYNETLSDPNILGSSLLIIGVGGLFFAAAAYGRHRISQNILASRTR